MRKYQNIHDYSCFHIMNVSIQINYHGSLKNNKFLHYATLENILVVSEDPLNLLWINQFIIVLLLREHLSFKHLHIRNTLSTFMIVTILKLTDFN